MNGRPTWSIYKILDQARKTECTDSTLIDTLMLTSASPFGPDTILFAMTSSAINGKISIGKMLLFQSKT